MAYSYSFTFESISALQIGVQSAAYDMAFTQAEGVDNALRRFKFTITPGSGDIAIAPADLVLEGENSPYGSGLWQTLALTKVGNSLVGYWGPPGGFPMSAAYSGTSQFRTTVNGPANNAGHYTLKVELVDGADASLSPAVTGVTGFDVAAQLAAAGNYEVDPISRIEGHLGVKLSVGSNGLVSGADVHGNLWRGFENFLIDREPNDAITFTQRICGVCPVPHGQTATFAADAVYGYNSNFQTWVMASEGGKWPGDDGASAPVDTPLDQGIPEKAVHIRNVVLGAEFLMSHITHLYHLAAPSYVQGPAVPPWTPYFDDSYYHPLLLSQGRALPEVEAGFSKDLWSAVITSYVKALRMRRLTFEAGALFAGRMPMTSCYVAGGVTNDSTANLATRCSKYRDIMTEIGSFIVKEFVPLFLTLGALYPGWDNTGNGGSGYGQGVGNFLAWGGFPQKDGTLGLARGYRLKTGVSGTITSQNVLDNLREFIGASHYAGSVTSGQVLADGSVSSVVATTVTNPATEARTVPNRAVGYSWLKAPRWNVSGTYYPMEVGPFARMVVGGLYPVDGVTTLASQPGLSPLYMRYVKTAAGNTGLDPAMVEADLAVALLREGLAEVWVGATHYTKSNTAGADNATLLSVYTNANAVIMGVVRDWIVGLKGGLSTMDRLRGRALESLVTVTKIVGDFTKGAVGGAPLTWKAVNATGTGIGWIQQLNNCTFTATYSHKTMPPGYRFGFGATEAPRGALMHMCATDKGKIVRYQCIVPTTWNAGPKDVPGGTEGPIEKAMIGIPYNAAGASFTNVAGNVQATGGGVEALRVAQSFDPCIACAVH